MTNYCFLKTEKVASTPQPSDLDGLPHPRVRWYPQFVFHENDRKGCKKDYLYALDNFFYRFRATGEKTLPCYRF